MIGETYLELEEVGAFIGNCNQLVMFDQELETAVELFPL